MSSDEETFLQSSQSTVICHGCGAEVDVVWSCSKSPTAFCDTCKATHATETTFISHTIETRSEIGIQTFHATQINKPCITHPERYINLYCNDCDTHCCLVCMEQHHRRHDIITIESKCKEREDKLNAIVKTLEKQCLTDLASNIEKLKESLKKNQKEFEDVRKEIEYLRQQLKESIDKSCDNILEDLKQRQDKQYSVLTAAIKNLESKIGGIQSTIAECSKTIRQGGLDLLGYNPTNPMQNGNSSPKPFVLRPSFVPWNNIAKIIENNLGNVVYECTGPDLAQRTIELTESFETEVSCDNIASGGNDTVWIANWKSDTMYLYDGKGKQLKSVSVGEEVWNFVVKRSGDVIVCNPDMKLRLVTQAGDVRKLVDTAPFVPRGMCLTTNEEMVVCMADQGDSNHLAVYTSDGKTMMRKIESKSGEGKQMLSDPLRVVMNGEYFSVMNHGRNVVTMEHSGKVRWMYEGVISGLNDRFKPTGMCIDHHRNLLISDNANHCIHYVGTEGGLIQLLLTKEQHGIECPWGICVDNEKSMVWVGREDTNTVKVFKYQFM